MDESIEDTAGSEISSQASGASSRTSYFEECPFRSEKNTTSSAVKDTYKMRDRRHWAARTLFPKGWLLYSKQYRLAVTSANSKGI